MNTTITPRQLLGQLNWRYAVKQFDSTRKISPEDRPTLDAWAGRQVAIALGNLLTSAALLGIDACPMEGFVPAQYDAILGLGNRGLSAVAICTLGFRSEKDTFATLPKVRFPKEQV